MVFNSVTIFNNDSVIDLDIKIAIVSISISVLIFLILAIVGDSVESLET